MTSCFQFVRRRVGKHGKEDLSGLETKCYIWWKPNSAENTVPAVKHGGGGTVACVVGMLFISRDWEPGQCSGQSYNKPSSLQETPQQGAVLHHIVPLLYLCSDGN